MDKDIDLFVELGIKLSNVLAEYDETGITIPVLIDLIAFGLTRSNVTQKMRVEALNVLKKTMGQRLKGEKKMNEEREANIAERCAAMEKKILDAIDDEEEDITIALTVMIELVHSIVMSYSDTHKVHLAVLQALETLYKRNNENDQT